MAFADRVFFATSIFDAFVETNTAQLVGLVDGHGRISPRKRSGIYREQFRDLGDDHVFFFAFHWIVRFGNRLMNGSGEGLRIDLNGRTIVLEMYTDFM